MPTKATKALAKIKLLGGDRVCGVRNEVKRANEGELADMSLIGNGKRPGKSCWSSSVELMDSCSDATG